jgi:hypothetical protein
VESIFAISGEVGEQICRVFSACGENAGDKCGSSKPEADKARERHLSKKGLR